MTSRRALRYREILSSAAKACNRSHDSTIIRTGGRWFQCSAIQPLAQSSSSSSPHSARRINLKENWLVNPDLKRYIRESLSENKTMSEEFSEDTGFSLSFLGTGAGRTALERSNSATALRMGSKTYLFDAGEGVQSQMMLSKLKLGDVERIFITHLHGDHIFGLPGLLLSMQESRFSSGAKQRGGQPRVLELYGPVGLFNYVSVSLSLSMTEIRKVNVVVYELCNDTRKRNHTNAQSHRWTHPGSVRRYREFRHRGIQQKLIPQNEDGTWTLCLADEIDSPEKAVKRASEPKGMYVTAAEIHHVPKVQCFGFVVEEPRTQPRKIDVVKAKAGGIAPGNKYKLLKSGFPVASDDDETRQIDADEVTGARPNPRKVAVLGDCFQVPKPMADLCKNADVVVHEATFCKGDKGGKVDFGGHSTAAMAGLFGKYCRPRVLALNHISPSVSHSEDLVAALVSETEDILSTTDTKVQVTYDFLELLVPRGGF